MAKPLAQFPPNTVRGREAHFKHARPAPATTGSFSKIDELLPDFLSQQDNFTLNLACRPQRCKNIIFCTIITDLLDSFSSGHNPLFARIR
jgi:hypothetical protein